MAHLHWQACEISSPMIQCARAVWGESHHDILAVLAVVLLFVVVWLLCPTGEARKIGHARHPRAAADTHASQKLVSTVHLGVRTSTAEEASPAAAAKIFSLGRSGRQRQALVSGAYGRSKATQGNFEELTLRALGDARTPAPLMRTWSKSSSERPHGATRKTKTWESGTLFYSSVAMAQRKIAAPPEASRQAQLNERMMANMHAAQKPSGMMQTRWNVHSLPAIELLFGRSAAALLQEAQEARAARPTLAQSRRL